MLHHASGILEIEFLSERNGKKNSQANKTGFGAESNGLQAKHFLKMELLASAFFSVLSVANADNVNY